MPSRVWYVCAEPLIELVLLGARIGLGEVCSYGAEKLAASDSEGSPSFYKNYCPGRFSGGRKGGPETVAILEFVF